jgi:2-keto-4-pentenoate hydratase/2-oxohepta-3-ene-1,7-dioic acid hydratase in catechol pathway
LRRRHAPRHGDRANYADRAAEGLTKLDHECEIAIVIGCRARMTRSRDSSAFETRLVAGEQPRPGQCRL